MGRRSSGPIGLDILGIGTTVAFFHALGYIFESIEAIRILYSRSGLFWRTSFQILMTYLGLAMQGGGVRYRHDSSTETWGGGLMT